MFCEYKTHGPPGPCHMVFCDHLPSSPPHSALVKHWDKPKMMSSVKSILSHPNPNSSDQEECIQVALVALTAAGTMPNGTPNLSIHQTAKDFNIPIQLSRPITMATQPVNLPIRVSESWVQLKSSFLSSGQRLWGNRACHSMHSTCWLCLGYCWCIHQPHLGQAFQSLPPRPSCQVDPEPWTILCMGAESHNFTGVFHAAEGTCQEVQDPSWKYL